MQFFLYIVIYCPTYNKLEQPGITESIKERKKPKGIKLNVKVINLDATYKAGLVGGRTDMFRERVPDGSPATENAVSPNLVLVLDVV